MKPLGKVLRQIKTSSFATKSISAFVIKVGAAGLSFLMFVFLAQAMSQDDFGRFGFAFSLATILGVLGSFGQRNLVLRYASIYIRENERAAAYTVIRRGYGLVIAGSAFLAILLVLAAGLVPALMDQRPLLLATSVLVVFLALAEFQPNPQRAAGRVWLALLPRDIILRLAMIALGCAAVGGVVSIDAVDAILFMALVLALLVLGQGILLPYTNPLRLIQEGNEFKDLLKWRHTMWGMWGNSVIMSSGRNLAVVIMAAVLPATTTGAVFAAMRTSMVLELFLVAVNVVAAPLLATRLQRRELPEVQHICRQIALMLGIPTLATFIVFVFYGDRLLELFGSGYAVAHTELIIMSFGYLVSAFCGPTTQLMEMAGYERPYFWMLAVTTAAALLALPLLSISFGSVGAAACIAFNLIGLNVASYLFISQRIGVVPGIIRLPRGYYGKEDTSID